MNANVKVQTAAATGFSHHFYLQRIAIIWLALVLAMLAPLAKAVPGIINMQVATYLTPMSCNWSIPGLFSTNATFLWTCGYPLQNPARLEMNQAVDLVPYQNYRSIISAASSEVCDALLTIPEDDCYYVFVNGANTTDSYPNWRDGYYLGEGPDAGSFSASFYIKPAPGMIPIAKFQIKGSTGCPLASHVEGGVYSVKADGISQALGTPINTTYPVTFVLESGPVGSSLSGGTLNVGTNAGVVHIFVQCDDPAPCLLRDFYFDVNDGTCSCLSSGSCSTETDSHCVDLRFNLGRSDQGTGNAFLEVRSENPDPALGTPFSLQCNFTRPELELITNSAGWLRQAKSLERLIDINTNTATSYYMNFYHASDVTGFNTNGLYDFTNAPFQSVFVQLVDGNTNHLQVMDSTQPGCIDYYWETNGWEMVSGLGARYETKLTFNNGAYYTNIDIVADGQGHVSYQTVETWENFSYGGRLLKRITGTGPSALTESYTYTADGMIQQANYTDGSWDIYTYDSLDRQIGDYSPYLNCAPTTNPALCRYTARTYTTNVISGSQDDGTDPYTPRMIVSYVLGTEVGRSYSVVKLGEQDDFQCANPGAAWTDSGNLETITIFDTDAVNMGKPLYIIHPDLTMQAFEYDSEATCPLPGSGDSLSKTTVWTGAPAPGDTAVVDGTMDETWTDGFQNNILHRVTDIASGVITEQEIYSYDQLDHPTNTTYLNRTSLQQVYDCCNLESQTGPDGTVTSYGYDALKRPIMTVQDGVTSSNVLDSSGNTIGAVRYGTDGSAITNDLSTYDAAGQLTSSTDGLGNTTTYTNYFDATNQLIKMTTYPDASTRIETYAEDGSLLSLTGTSVLPVRYAYGVESDGGIQRAYKQTIKLTASDADTTEWTKTYTDMLGRAYKTVYSSASGTPSSQSFYNSLGQLSRQVDPDGVATLYQYNAKGQVAYTAVDMNTNGVIDFSGSDRITSVVSDVISNGYNLYLNRSRTFVWGVNGSNASNLVATAETSVDGLQSWNMVWNNGVGVTNYSRTDYAPAEGQRVMTSVAPDGSSQVATTQYGQPISTVQSDANGMAISQTSLGYDTQGRQNTVTDARNGTTVNYFNNNDQVVASLTPSPDAIQSGQLTTNILDSLGRTLQTILPDGTKVTNAYFANGLLQQTSGSRTYPVAYTYDYAGRMQTMTTWTNFGSASGSAVTTWDYDADRGFLTSKAYADGHGPSYGYTAAGRRATRTWARGITTTYSYDNAGGLGSVLYSDATPGMTNTFDRLGREITVTNGATVCNWMYNNLGELLSEAYSGGPLAGWVITNSYDRLLRRTNVSLVNTGSVLASTQYGYDAASRLATVGDGTNSAGYGYLANASLVGNIAFERNGQMVMTTAKQYDNLNRLTSTASSAGAPVSSFNYQYNSANQRTSATNVDSSYWVYQYDALGQVVSGKKYWADGTPVAGQQFTYNFDTIGNREATASGGDGSGANLRTANYTANNLNEYTHRDVPGYVTVLGSANPNATVTVNLQRAYRYGSYFQDELAVNNSSAALWQALTNLAVLNNGTNADIIATNTGNVLVPETPEVFGYDLDGNLTNSGRWTIVWDAENRATSFASLSSSPAASQKKVDCLYDSQGRRIQKVVSTWNGSAYVAQSTNRFIYDGWNLVGILDGYNHLLDSFQWGTDLSGSVQGAGGVGGLISMTVCSGTNAGTYFYSYDGNGNVTALVNAANGTIVGQWEYDPFLGISRASGVLASINPFLGSTKFYDSETGLYYYGYRYYDSSAGRWLSRDPIEESGGINLYEFVSNRAIGSIDLLGLQTAFDEVDIDFERPDPIYARGTMPSEEVINEENQLINNGSPAETYIGSQFQPVSVAEFNESMSKVISEATNERLPDNQEAEVASSRLPPPRPPCNNKIASGFPGDENHDHHRLPRQFKNWFSAAPRNLDIEDYKASMPMQWHIGEDIGLHSIGYNDMWTGFIVGNPDASSQETLAFMKYLENTLGFGDLPPTK